MFFLCGEFDGGVRLFIPDFSWKPVADYIDQQFEQYFRDESGLNRKNIQDNRVHCCLYFISPFGHGYDTVVVLPSFVFFSLPLLFPPLCRTNEYLDRALQMLDLH